MTPAEIARRVRNVAGDVSVQQFDNVTLTDWMNSACRQIAVDNSLLEKTATTSLTAGSQEVTLPTDIFKLHSVSIDGDNLRVVSYQDYQTYIGDSVGVSTAVGQPTIAYPWAGKLVVSPKPAQTYSLRINYTSTPAAIAYSEPGLVPTWTPAVLPVPESYHDRIVTYCLAQVALQDDDPNKYTLLMQEFTTGVAATQHQGKSEENVYPGVSVSPRDTGGFSEGYWEW